MRTYVGVTKCECQRHALLLIFEYQRGEMANQVVVNNALNCTLKNHENLLTEAHHVQTQRYPFPVSNIKMAPLSGE